MGNLTACTVGFESRPRGFEPFEFLEGVTGLTGFDNCAILPSTASSDWVISLLFLEISGGSVCSFGPPTIRVNW